MVLDEVDVKPFLKWAGGKGRLLPQLRPLLPEGVEDMRHVEPFLGGGALFFARRPTRALLGDINRDLVTTYVAVRDRVEEVIAELAPLAFECNHALHAMSHRAYCAVREAYNDRRNLPAGPRRAAHFIYLNKTCFNGLYRVNKKGDFNVPAGKYENPRILDADHLRACSRQLAGVELFHDSFEILRNLAQPDDFVYMDPPYEPVSRTANFTGYAAGGFSWVAQICLRDVFDKLTERGCKCMLSNSDVPFIRDLYQQHRIDVVQAARSINRDAKGRGKVAELVIRNY